MTDRISKPNGPPASDSLDGLQEVVASRIEAQTAADEDEEGVRGRKARSLVAGLATLNLLLLAIIVAKTAGSQTTLAEAVEVQANAAAEVAQVAEGTPSPQPVATSTGRRVPAVSAPRVSGKWFVPNGDISDIVCRPHEGEAEELWRARVPTYCKP